ncbi:MAG: hypothetical protein QM802_18890 [Agriterribacter sp.]
MNIRFKSRYLVLAFSLVTFFSCKKDDTTSPAPPEEKPTLFSQVQGRWDASIEVPPRISNPAVLGKVKPSSKIQDMPYVTTVEFFSDSSYILVFNYSETHINKFSAKDSATLTFAGFGDISDIKVAGDSISFSCSYDDIPVTVKAKKVAPLTLAEDRKSLVNDWLVTHQEDGDSLYNAGFGGDGFPEGSEIYFQFTAAGTFAYKVSYSGQTMAMSMNWKIDAEQSNIVRVYSNIYGYGDHDDFIRIVSLSASTATIELVSYKEQESRISNSNINGKISGDPQYVEQVTTLVLTKK